MRKQKIYYYEIETSPFLIAAMITFPLYANDIELKTGGTPYDVNTNISTDEYSIKVMEVDKHPTKQKELLPLYLHSMYLYW